SANMTNDDPSKFELVINVANGEATRPPCRRRCSRPPTRAIDKACLAAIAHSRFWHEAAVRKRSVLRRLGLSGGKICGGLYSLQRVCTRPASHACLCSPHL